MQTDKVKCGEDMTPHVLVGVYMVEPFRNTVFTTLYVPALGTSLSQQKCSRTATSNPTRTCDSTPPAMARGQNSGKCQQQSHGLVAMAVRINVY